MMRWRDVWVLFRREMRAALRERTIVVNSFLIPLLLYPFLLWVMFSGVMFVQGQTEGFVSRVSLEGLPERHADLRRALAQEEKVRIEPSSGGAEAAAAIRAGDLDAALRFEAPTGTAAALAGNFRVVLTYDGAKERSRAAEGRLQDILATYRSHWLEREARSYGLAPTQWALFSITTDNVASGKEMGAFLLGLMLPLFFVIMVAVGTFYPAVDATAGERERSTWETTMSLAVARSSILAAKYLYVATLGCIAGVLNLAAMTFSMKAVVAPLLGPGEQGIEFSLPLTGLPVVVLAALLLAGFVAAGMMLFASFARTFKEGQAMVSPFYMLVFLPAMFLAVPGIEFTTTLALVPVVNVAMVLREAIAGTFHWPQIAITTGVGVVSIAACLWLATRVVQFEDVVIGSYSGSLLTFVKQRLLRRGSPRRVAEGRS
jgi:sodium transport system permease protein